MCATEVEVDILTGVHQINRVDLLEDTGDSMSPCIDIGQIEGAYIMGLGFWTTEKTVYNSEGRILTDRTWNYKIPCALDIPIDFRVKFPKDNPNPNGVLHSKGIKAIFVKTVVFTYLDYDVLQQLPNHPYVLHVQFL